MKPLSKIYTELGIDFTFPITIIDTKGKLTYHENSDGYWSKSQYNGNDNETYYETSNGFWSKSQYDGNGNITYYEDSEGFWSKSQYDGNGNETYYETSTGRWSKSEYDENGNLTYYKDSYGAKKGTTKSQSCAGEVIEVNGIKYKLTPVK